MTYFELYEQALHKLNYEGGTVAEFQKMIEPLNQEIPEKKMKSPEELYRDIVEKFSEEIEDSHKSKTIKFFHDWIPVEDQVPDVSKTYIVTVEYQAETKFSSVLSAYWNNHYRLWLLPLNYPGKVVAWLPIGVYND